MTVLATLRFLVVEDHGFQRWLICDLLEQMGVRSVEPAPDGAAALERLASGEPIDVVVSDLDMPGMDGMQLIRHMAERGHPACLIVLSAQEPGVLASVEVMAREYGVRLLAVVQKPFTPAKLDQAVASLGASRALRAESIPPVDGFAPEEIAEALRRGEFEAFFQPKVETKSRRIVGAEALVRWRHSVRGAVIPPSAFVDTVERHGLIDALTNQIARQAMEACRDWRSRGKDIGVAINLSVLSLPESTLAQRMTELAAHCGLEPRHVTFEITETAAVAELGPKLETLSRLRMKGFGLSIDDFGTGYSSMHRLSRLPFTELKIDKAFVSRVGSHTASRAIVESSLDLATKLKLGAVAEGVETQAEWEVLMALGCPVMQGFYVAAAMSAAEFNEWLERSNEDCA